VSGGDGIDLTGGSSTVKGLTFEHFANGIGLLFSGNNTVKQCFIGTNAAGNNVAGNNNGIDIEFGSNNNVIGSDVPVERNVISGNIFYGIYANFSNNDIIKGNYIGTDLTGTVAVPNLVGVTLSSGTGSTIGGTINDGATVRANVISGNVGDGIDLTFSANNNVIEGNYIGLATGGTLALGNLVDGISIANGSNGNFIGGTAPSGSANPYTNYIAANERYGISVFTGDSNKIQGNWIGTTLGGTALTTYGNGTAGILLSSATNSLVGGTVMNGTTHAQGNLISNNAGDGLDIVGGSGNVVQGNFIGTDATGTGALANSINGITVSGGANNNTIGGTVLVGTVNVSGNVIAANKQSGIYIQDATTSKTLVEGNLIGNYTDPLTGMTQPLPNGTNGVTIFDEAHDNVIGGTILNGTIHNARNIISGNNKGFGVLITHEKGAANNAVLDNYIGTDITGTLAVPNLEGVGISDGAAGNYVGAITTTSTNGSPPYLLAANLISYNTRYGVGIFGQGSGGNVVIANDIGCFINTADATKTIAESNGDGVLLYDGATGNYIGQTIVVLDNSQI
jgi:titin